LCIYKFCSDTTGKLPRAAEIKQLLAQARARLLQPVNLHLPQSDLDPAKRLAGKTGKGYQRGLKAPPLTRHARPDARRHIMQKKSLHGQQAMFTFKRE
jgi:hypothetical protein